VDVATAVELIHAASLIHDDVIDHADSRRGQPTISARWGDHRAVLYGDFLFARAFTLLTNHGHTGILGNMTRAISLMCQGEIEQYALRYNCQLSEADYMSYVHRKTAFFLSACCLSGAEVCGLSSLQQKCLAAFGLQLGYAFQLTDDILDFRGNARETGKPVLHDLAEGYLTLPVIKLLRNPEHGLLVKHIIEERDFTTEKLSYINQALECTGILREVEQKARMIITRAKQNLSRLPNKPARATLSRLASHIIQRVF
jgi:heptaprenyl diphosphate synthase